MPFNLTNTTALSEPLILHQTFPTFIFWKFEKHFVSRIGTKPSLQWNEVQQATFVERLIKRQDMSPLILREILSPYHETRDKREFPLSQTHTVFEVLDGWQRIMTLQRFQQSNDFQKTLYLPKSISTVPAFKRLCFHHTTDEICKINLDTADAIAYDDFTMVNVAIITGVPDRDDSNHQSLAEQEFEKLRTDHSQNVAYPL